MKIVTCVALILFASAAADAHAVSEVVSILNIDPMLPSIRFCRGTQTASVFTQSRTARGLSCGIEGAGSFVFRTMEQQRVHQSLVSKQASLGHLAFRQG